MTEVLESPVVQRSNVKPRRQPPHVVIVFNDDDHTFDYVIHTFQKVFGYSLEKAFGLAETIHLAGKALVWTGAKEVAELKAEQIEQSGPDIYASKPVDYPLRTAVEPLPE